MLDFIIPLTISIAIIPVLILVAIRMNFVDQPDTRKQHAKPTPIVGGLAIFCAAFGYLSIFHPSTASLTLIAIGLIVVLLGAVDDRLSLSPLVRLIVQAGAACSMILFADLQIQQIGDIFFGDVVELGVAFSIFFTIMCTIGVINSINMIDGVDGLAGSTILVSVLALAFVAASGSDAYSLPALLAVAGALVGFLLFNARLLVTSAKVFLGDAGSMLLGFTLVWFCIKLSQGPDAVLSPVAAGWIFGLPLIDTVSVMVRRITARTSPFKAGRDHLHHRLLNANFSVNGTVLTILSVHSVIVCIGLLLNQVDKVEPILFWVFVCFVLAHHFITPILLDKWSRESIPA